MSEGVPKNNENVVELSAWRERKEAAQEKASEVLAGIDSKLVGQERCDAIVGLMHKLDAEDPQGNYYIIKRLAEVVSIEEPAARSAEKRAVHPEAAALAKTAANTNAAPLQAA